MNVRARMLAGHCLFLLALLAGCGTPGVPLPPSLRLPKPVEDLKAVRKGDRVFLQWQEPTETTDRQGIKGETTMRLCRSYRTQNQAVCNNVVAEIKSIGNVSGTPIQQVDDLSSILKTYTTQDYVIYSVEVLNDRGHSAGPSNAATIFLAPSLPAARDVRATLASRSAILLQWNGSALPTALRTLNQTYLYRISRMVRDPGPAASGSRTPRKPERPAVLAEFPAAAGGQSFEDKSFEWQKSYEYHVVGVTQVRSREGKLLSEFESDDSPPAEIVAQDVFAPDPPQGLQAVFTNGEKENYVDLSWSPSEENDVVGYNLYRNEENQPPVRINPAPLKTSTFHDNNVTSGKTYTYHVTAINLRNNESKPSESATEKVP